MSQNSMTLSSSHVGQVGISLWEDRYVVTAVAYLADVVDEFAVSDLIRYFDFEITEQRAAWAWGRRLATLCDEGRPFVAFLASEAVNF